MENEQCGRQVTFSVEKTLTRFQTDKSLVEYVQTKYHGDILLMNGEVQFSTLDERLYHRELVRNALVGNSVLIIGGGDGLALRDIYKEHPNVKRAVLVDWDEEFVNKFSMDYYLNNGSLRDPRTVIVYMDAVEFLDKAREQFDTIIIDLPDPEGKAMEDLYISILRRINRVMKTHTRVNMHIGVLSMHPEHPCWKFVNRLEEIETLYNCSVSLSATYVPSFTNIWGFLKFTRNIREWEGSLLRLEARLPVDLLELMPAMAFSMASATAPF